jgi:hypothetical protein
MAKGQRILIWQITNDGEGFACTSCSWQFPNPEELAEGEHDAKQVYRRFCAHVCSAETSLKKDNWVR